MIRVSETEGSESDQAVTKTDLEKRLLWLELQEKTRPEWLRPSAAERLAQEWGSLAAVETALITLPLAYHLITKGWTDAVLLASIPWIVGVTVTAMWIRDKRAARRVERLLGETGQEADSDA